MKQAVNSKTALLELSGLADVFVGDVTIITIIYFAEYQVVLREANSSLVVHMVHYIMLFPHTHYSLLRSLKIIIKVHIHTTVLVSECSS